MAKQNDKQQHQQIAGFHLGGLIPLDRVGYVLAALYENAAENLQIAPQLPDPRQQSKQQRRLSDLEGIAGLLGPPQESAVVGPAPADRIQTLIEIVSTAPPEGLKKNEIVTALKVAGVSGALMEGSNLTGLVNDHILKRVGFGVYVLGKNAKSPPPSAPKQQAPPAQTKTVENKREAILQILSEYGPEGAERIEIQKKLGDYGFGNQHFDAKPLVALTSSGHVTRLAKGKYALANAALVAGGHAKPAPANEGGKKTMSAHVLEYLRESAPQTRTVKEITEKLNKASIGTPMSVGVELSKMFNKKMIARPSTGIYGLLPE